MRQKPPNHAARRALPDAETRRTAEKIATSSMNAARRLASGKVDFTVTERGPTWPNISPPTSMPEAKSRIAAAP